MRATQQLPEGYRAAGTVDVSKDRRLIIALNIAGLVLLILSGWFFFWALARMRAGDAVIVAGQTTIDSLSDVLLAIMLVIGLTAVNVVLHEGVHGFFFWLFTRDRPKFAFRGAYAYAAAPDWYLPRGAFLITTLAPLVVISFAGVMLFRILPVSLLLPTWLVLVLNASGAVGDMLVAVWLLTKPRSSLVNDRGDAVTVFSHTD